MDIREFEDKRTTHVAGEPQPQSWSEPKIKSDINENIKEQGTRLASSGRDMTIKELSRVSSAFHAAADKLHEQNDFFAGWIDSAAERLDSASNYFREHNPDEIMHDVQDFSKHNPYITVGGMFVAGLAVSRLLKSGSGRQP